MVVHTEHFSLLQNKSGSLARTLKSGITKSTLYRFETPDYINFRTKQKKILYFMDEIHKPLKRAIILE